MILRPEEYFTIFRQLDDHTDPSVDAYYVRATIRDGRTSALIATVNLTSRGAGEYSANWQVPADPSGQGFYIKVTTSVYTDSGYSTKSTAYGDEGATYLIAERYNPAYGHGGGMDVDYKKIDKMIAERIQAIPQPQPVDMTPVVEAVKALEQSVKAIKEPTVVDLEPLKTGLNEVKEAVAAIKMPEINFDTKSMAEEVTKSLTPGLTEEVKAAFKGVEECVETSMANFVMVPLKRPLNGEKPMTDEDYVENVRQMMEDDHA